MKLYFSTNLDDPRRDIWDLNKKIEGIDFPVPRVGEKITFNFKRNFSNFPHEREFSYDLEVVDVSYSCVKSGALDRALNNGNDFHISVKVELHIPTGMGDSIQSWSERFKKHRFGKESY